MYQNFKSRGVVVEPRGGRMIHRRTKKYMDHPILFEETKLQIKAFTRF
jgi:hypothetical protein